MRTPTRVIRAALAMLALAVAVTAAAQQSEAPQGQAPQNQTPQGQVPPAKAPAAPEASATDIDGATLFATVCGWCHENGGRTAGKGPKLAGTTRSDEFILNRIRTGKPGAMPAFGGSFSEGQIAAIVAYIRTLEDTP